MFPDLVTTVVRRQLELLSKEVASGYTCSVNGSNVAPLGTQVNCRPAPRYLVRFSNLARHFPTFNDRYKIWIEYSRTKNSIKIFPKYRTCVRHTTKLPLIICSNKSKTFIWSLSISSFFFSRQGSFPADCKDPRWILVNVFVRNWFDFQKRHLESLLSTHCFVEDLILDLAPPVRIASISPEFVIIRKN